MTISTTSTFYTDSDGRAAVSHPGLGGSSCTLISVRYTLSKPGYQFSVPEGFAPCGPINSDLQILASALSPIISVSSANYQRYLSNEMIASSFGENMAAATESAPLPLPTMLAGRRLLITDSAGQEKTAKLLFVSPTQINFIMPSGLANGVATSRLIDENGNQIKFGFVEIARVAPGIFTADASGRGLPAAAIVRSSSGFQVYEPVAKFDSALLQNIPIEIDLGHPSEVVVLVLFGTGWRQADPSEVQVNISNNAGGVFCPLQYAGRQPTIEGLDQINVFLPQTLAGKGDVTVRVTVAGIRANDVQLKIK
ncbi:MAG: hypothetical protein JNK38_07105 [Acidobacteria bacterium]|nr:hypothetical protein [Acidobacteriota bacterium]